MADFLPRASAPAVDNAGRFTRETYDALRRAFDSLSRRQAELESAQAAVAAILQSLGAADIEELQSLGDLLGGKQDASQVLDALSDILTDGIVVKFGPTAYGRSIAAGAGIDVANGSGTGGNPTVSLADLADSGTGTFKLLTRDAKGRLSGTANGTTTNVPEGTNLYYTDARADARAAAAVATHEAATDPHPQYLTGAEGDAAYAPLAHVGAGGSAHANAVAAGAAGFMTGADKTKLDGVQAGATANSTDAQLRDRATHTGTQLASTISDFAATVRATVLTGLSTATNAVIAATDTVLSALGKLQAQISAHLADTADPHATVVQTITDGDTTHAPSGDVVFDALALKFDKAGGTISGAVSILHGSGQDLGLYLGSSATDATVKDTRILCRHYTASEEGISVFGGASFNPADFNSAGLATGGNQARFGGGFGVQNAATAVLFYTGETTNTLSGTLRWGISSAGHFWAGADNSYDIGSASFRAREIFAGNATINTSDARDKRIRGPLTKPEIAAAREIKTAVVMYQWNDAIAEKGEDARLHCSPTVQSVIGIMEKHGLDPFRYGFVCYDQWEATPEVLDEETGQVTQPARPAGDRYSLRPTELLFFIMAAG